MPSTKTTPERTRTRRPLFDNGVAALAFALVCLVAPVLLEGSGDSSAIAEMLRIPAAVGLALGVVLLALDWSARRHPRTGFLSTQAQMPQAGTQEAQGAWSAALLDGLDQPAFEALCERLFAQAGFEPRPQPRQGGNALDLCLYSRHAPGAPVSLVRCRHACGRELDASELRGLHLALAAHSLERGTCATDGVFTPEARQFAKEHGINALDRERLLALIGTRTQAQQQELLAAAGTDR
jgi:restriction system protein